jgi:hypothetical protein
MFPHQEKVVKPAMDSMVLVALSLLFVLPLFVGIFIVVIHSFSNRWLLGAMLVLSLLTLTWLALAGEQTINLPFSFLGEPISLSISKTAIALYAALLIVLGVLVYFRRPRPIAFSRYETSLLAFSLSAGMLAFFSNQFMIRYIALEIVGLLASMAVCPSPGKDGFRRFGKVFLTLRIGDIGLLASILLIQAESGTLLISEMVEAAVALPLPQQAWAVAGFVLAGLVKMGVIPFTGWQEEAWSINKSPVMWIPAFLMPGLGMYLLYRVYPILASASVFRIGLPLLATVLVFLQLLAGWKKPRFVRLGSALNAFVLLIAALGSGALLRDYFLGLMVFRLIVFLKDRETVQHRWSLLVFFPILLNLTILALHWETFSTLTWMLWIGLTACLVLLELNSNKRERDEAAEVIKVEAGPGTLTVLAEWLYEHLEMRLFSEGVLSLASAFSRLVGGLHHHLEINGLDRGLVCLAEWFSKAVDWLRRNFEMGFDRIWAGLGKLLSRVSGGWLRGVEISGDRKAAVWVEDMIQSVDEREQELQSRPLHRDLIWIPVLMVFILVFLYFVRGG